MSRSVVEQLCSGEIWGRPILYGRGARGGVVSHRVQFSFSLNYLLGPFIFMNIKL